MSLRQPTQRELRAWYLFMQLDGGNPSNPEAILGYLNQFDSEGIPAVHAMLHKEYEEFRQQFHPANY